MAPPINNPMTTEPVAELVAMQRDRRREITIAVAFAALCAVGLWTVLIPELRGSDPDTQATTPVESDVNKTPEPETATQ